MLGTGRTGSDTELATTVEFDDTEEVTGAELDTRPW